MTNTKFIALLDALLDLTPTQKRYLISQAKSSLHDEPKTIRTAEILTEEELDALLHPEPETHAK